MSSSLRSCQPRRLHLVLAAALLAVGLLTPALAADPAEPMALTKIMQGLGTDMQGITHAVLLEDWSTVEKLATRVADHPEPPLLEKVRILTFIGMDAGRFRGYDQQAHDAALLLAQAAHRKDGAAAIAEFAEVQTACLGCHQNFRKPFQARFHVQPE